ncbi:MAG: hypothetical protein ACXWLZ_03375 [Rhizomicrobium sp.]
MFESDLSGRRQSGSARLGPDAIDGPYRLRSGAAVAWPAQGYGQRTGIGHLVGEAVSAVVRSILPVLFLTVTLFVMYLYIDRALPYFADSQGQWLRLSDVLLPAAFFTIHLTNRRYGPSYAFAQIVLSFLLCGAITLFGPDLVRQLLPATVMPSVREVAAFVLAFFVAGFLAIVAFDAARGPRWWMAPLIGSFVAGVAYVLIFYPVAYAGTASLWGSHMLTHAGILTCAAISGLVPFWMLRGTIQPLSGFGGY